MGVGCLRMQLEHENRAPTVERGDNCYHVFLGFLASSNNRWHSSLSPMRCGLPLNAKVFVPTFLNPLFATNPLPDADLIPVDLPRFALFLLIA